MMKYSLIAAALGAGLAFGPSGMAQDRDRERREQPRNNFHFRQEDAGRLREHYRTNYREQERFEGNRVRLEVGARLPEGWRGHIRRVPEVVLRELGPIPTGLEVGYYDGYAVAYDPRTGEIVEVLDVY